MSEGFSSGTLLRVFIGEADTLEGVPVYERLLVAAKEAGIAGAGVYRGIESFGQNGKVHTARLLRLAEDLPVVFEAVDEPGLIGSFLKTASEIVEKSGGGGLVVTMPVSMHRIESSKKRG